MINQQDLNELCLHYLTLCKQRSDYTPEMIASELSHEIDKLYSSNHPVIVCLCGSTKFGEAFRLAQLQETLSGKIVLTIGCNMNSDEDLFVNMNQVVKDALKKVLDELHLRKIDMADEVLIHNVAGYIGESTKREYEYAQDHHKKIRWLEPIGAPHLRDPMCPCEDFEPIDTAYGKGGQGDCETDGHYMCATCVYRAPTNPR